MINLVPRSHPLSERNSLVTQVEFLEIVHPFTTVFNLETFKTFLRITRSKQVWIQNFTVVRDSRVHVCQQCIVRGLGLGLTFGVKNQKKIKGTTKPLMANLDITYRGSKMQSHWSLPLLGNKLKKSNFVHQTVFR